MFERTLGAVRALPTTSLLVIAGGRTLLEYGDTSEVGYVASVRKSLLSMLYGRSVAEGVIELDATLAELNIDDVEGLLPAEHKATVRQLLMASSGVYHPAASPGDDANLPARGTHAPGARFHYNNWDFNVLGTIYEQATGRPVFGALRDQLAVPLGLKDFDPDRQRLLGQPQRSRHLAHHMFLSGRDLARFGELMLAGGGGLVPGQWVRQSTARQVRLGPNSPLDYGFLWWLPRTWPGSFLAAGNFGQFLFCLPDQDLVVVHRRIVPDESAIRRNETMGEGEQLDGVSTGQFLRLLPTLLAELN